MIKKAIYDLVNGKDLSLDETCEVMYFEEKTGGIR